MIASLPPTTITHSTFVDFAPAQEESDDPA